MRTLIGALALGMTASLASAAQPTPEATWYADFDEAVRAAKEADKDLFVDFTGSDWCHWCKLLDGEVFEFDEFLVPIQENFILVALDFPNAEEIKAKIPNPERNDELMAEFGVGGFPTILLMTAEGEVFARTGYQEGGPEKYMEHVREITVAGKQALAEAKEFLQKFEAASAEEKPAMLGEAIDKFEGLEGDSPAVPVIAKVVRAAFRIDADNAQGLKLRAIKALMGAGMLDDQVSAAARELDPNNEEGLLEQLVWALFTNVTSDESAVAALDGLDSMEELTFQDQELAFNMYFMAARWCAEPLDDKDRAAGYAKRALEIGSEDERSLQFLEDLIE